MNSVGIIGFGSFGAFLAGKLSSTLIVRAYDPQVDIPVPYKATFADVCRSDYLVLAIPISAYEDVLSHVTPHLNPSTVIVDISSVKTIPHEIVSSALPHNPKVFTHPLFGPQSAQDTLSGHTLVMCPSVSDQVPYKKIKQFATSLGLKIEEMTPQAHDKEMAHVHALTFFIARATLQMGVHARAITTPSFKKLIDLADLEKHHSEDLFRTIQQSNPYASEVRKAFLEVAHTLNAKIEAE